MTMIIVFVSQLLFNLLRNLSNRYVVNNHIVHSVAMSIAIQSLWLISTAIGVKATLDMDIIVIVAYVAGGAIGTLLNFRVKIVSKHSSTILD